MAKEAPQEEAQRAVTEFRQGLNLPASYAIETVEDAIGAGAMLVAIKAKQKELDERKRAVTRPLDEAKRNALALFTPLETQLKAAEASLKQAILAYNRQVEAARAAEEARLREAQREAEEAAQARADKLLKQGKVERAEAVLAAIPPVPIVVADAPKLEGISERGIWKAEVTNLMALCAAIINGTAPIAYIEANQVALNAYARAAKGQAYVSGVRFYEERGISARS